MRVITGTARGRRLATLPGLDTRPTSDRIKEAVFNILQFEIEGRRVLDLFAGSGQLGIEALSRGAAGCVFIDRNPQAAAIIKDNLKHAGLTAGTQVLCQDALSFFVHPNDRFDLVLIDPPYASGLYQPVLERLSPIVRPGGAVVCECDVRTVLPERVDGLQKERVFRYGKTAIWLYRRAAEQKDGE